MRWEFTKAVSNALREQISKIAGNNINGSKSAYKGIIRRDRNSNRVCCDTWIILFGGKENSKHALLAGVSL